MGGHPREAPGQTIWQHQAQDQAQPSPQRYITASPGDHPLAVSQGAHQLSGLVPQRQDAYAIPRPHRSVPLGVAKTVPPQMSRIACNPHSTGALSSHSTDVAPQRSYYSDSIARSMPRASLSNPTSAASYSTTLDQNAFPHQTAQGTRASSRASASIGDSSTMSGPATTMTAENIKVLLRDRLPDDQPGTSAYQGYIRGAADFRQQYQQYLSLSFRPAGNAADFPNTDEGLRALAQGLSDAMLDMDGAVEAGQKSVTRIFQLSPYEVELKSWELLFVLRDVQLGRVGLPGWGKLWAGEDFDSFTDRYNDAVNKLHVSKSIASSLFDQNFSVRLALAPATELKKKIANMNNNARRAVELAMVRGMKSRKQEKDAKLYDNTDLASESMKPGDNPALATAHVASLKRPHQQDYIPEGDQVSDGNQQAKRFRPESSYATSHYQMHQAQDYMPMGHNSYRAGTSESIEWAPTDSVSPGFETPGLTPSSGAGESAGHTDTRCLSNGYAFGDTAATINNAKPNLGPGQIFDQDFANWLNDEANDGSEAFHLSSVESYNPHAGSARGEDAGNALGGDNMLGYGLVAAEADFAVDIDKDYWN